MRLSQDGKQCVRSDAEDKPGCSGWSNERASEEFEKRNKKVRQFKLPDNDDEMNDVSRKMFAPQSQKKMKWAVNLYSDLYSGEKTDLKTVWQHQKLLEPILTNFLSLTRVIYAFLYAVL